jgi:predicted DNA-binding protein (UPF0251 family)
MTEDQAQDMLRRAMEATVPKAFRPKAQQMRSAGRAASAKAATEFRNNVRPRFWALRDAGFNNVQAAKALGVTRSTVNRIVKEGRPLVEAVDGAGI